jgi:hypothetical protein
MAGSVERHHVVSEPVWWRNGSVGREIRCTTCSPARLLWQSSPYQPFDTTVAFLASVADGHQAEFGTAEEVGEDPEDENDAGGPSPTPEGDHPDHPDAENGPEGDHPDISSIH